MVRTRPDRTTLMELGGTIFDFQTSLSIFENLSDRKWATTGARRAHGPGGLYGVIESPHVPTKNKIFVYGIGLPPLCCYK